MTEKLYIAGHPVAHSKSPAMYNALFRRYHLDWEYGFADEPDEAAAEALFRAREFLSLNVTTPYKQTALSCADLPAASAKLAGGANVLLNLNGELIAYNVDGLGCVGYLESKGVRFREAEVAVCGTGPTSVAIMHAAVEAGAARAVLLGRSKERAQARMRAYLDQFQELVSTAIPLPSPVEGHLSLVEAYEHAEFSFGEYESARSVLSEADVIIDATPLGMHEGDPAPFDASALHEGQTVMDVVYGHGPSALLSEAQSAGARIFDGRGMLVMQAVETAEILFDVFSAFGAMMEDPPREDMFKVMADAAGWEL